MSERDEGERGEPAQPVPDANAGTDEAPDAGQAAQTNQKAEREWWDDPRLPWSGEPTKADKRCWAAFLLLGLYGLIMIPLRPVILGLSTYALAVISGSTVAMVDIGAGVRLGGEPHWWFWVTVAALSLMKFDWIFWWAGRLWGHGMIEVLAGRSKWAARTARHAERLADRFGWLAVPLARLVPFVPSAVVDVFVGMAGMRLRTYLVLNFLGSLANRLVFLYLGYRLGEPAKEAVDLIQKYSLYISIALVVVIIANSIRNSRKDSGRSA